MEQDDVQLIACIPRLRCYARAVVGNRGNADDLMRDTMELGWSRLSSWRRGSDMRAWLFDIMHNLYVDQLRKPVLATDILDDDTPVTLVRAAQADGLEICDMEAALQSLPPEQREIPFAVAAQELRAGGESPQLALLAHQAAIAHVVYSPDAGHPVEVGADQKAHLVTWLSKLDGKFGYALPGTIDKATLADVAAAVYEQLDKPP